MGSILLFLSVCICGICAFLCFLPVKYDRKRMLVIILWSIGSVFILVCFIMMLRFLIAADFRYLYAYSHISADTPLLYRISSLWAGQEGSFLLWALIMAATGFAVVLIKADNSDKILGIYCIISFFIFLICFILNPFELISVVPSNGLGLAAALENPWMVIHPPLVFIAYSAMAVLFSLSVLLAKNKNTMNLYLINKWIRLSMLFLGAGILSGSIWAYHALGWGGYWAWDPIENISLITWLVLSGYLHKLEYRNLSVCILPFATACLGTFLARSGVLSGLSAHAYTENNIIITQIIMFFLFGVVLFLDINRRKNKKSKKTETGYFKNYKNLTSFAIYAYAAFILLGTVAPIISKTETPSSYYIITSIFFILVFITALFMKDINLIKKRSIAMIIISTAFTAGITLLAGSERIWWILLIWITLMPLSLWIASGKYRNNWKYYLSHAGIIILITGAICSSALAKEGFVLTNPNYNIQIQQNNISIDDISGTSTLIISKPKYDTVIECADIISGIDGNILIPYITKPLIILFWIGSLIVVLQPITGLISGKLKYKDEDIIQFNKESDSDANV